MDKITRSASQPVDLQMASQQTQNYRAVIEKLGFQEIGFFIKAEDLITALGLPQGTVPAQGIGGIRVYPALEDYDGGKTRSHLYVVATDDALVPNDIVMDQNGDSLVYDMTWPCPHLCSSGNELNGNMQVKTPQ